MRPHGSRQKSVIQPGVDPVQQIKSPNSALPQSLTLQVRPRRVKHRQRNQAQAGCYR